MKKLLFLMSISFVFFSCKDNSKNNLCDYTKYEITTDVATKMIDYKEGCPVDSQKRPKIIDDNKCVLDEIRKKFPDCTIGTVDARYRKDDETRYCQTRGYESDPKKCAVEYYSTHIYKVECKGSNTRYFDFVKLCPPPRGCEPPDTLRNQK